MMSQGFFHFQMLHVEYSFCIDAGETTEVEKEKKKDDKVFHSSSRNKGVIVKANSFPFTDTHLHSHPVMDNLTPPPNMLIFC